MSFRVLENAVVCTRREIRNRYYDGVCSTSRVCDVCSTKFIYPMNLWSMCVKASFLDDNQVPQPKYQCFCALISVRIRTMSKVRSLVSIFCCSLLVLKISCSVVVDAHKSCPSWLWSHNRYSYIGLLFRSHFIVWLIGVFIDTQT